MIPRKLINFKEIPEMLAIDGKVLSPPHIKQPLTVVTQNCKKSAQEHSIEKSMLLNLLDLSTIFCPSNTISLSRHEQVCLMRLRFER